MRAREKAKSRSQRRRVLINAGATMTRRGPQLCKSKRRTRAATRGFQKPTTPQERAELEIKELLDGLETQSCRELMDSKYDRLEFACDACKRIRWFLPGAHRWHSAEQLKSWGIQSNGCAASEVTGLPEGVGPMVDRAGKSTPSCKRIHQSRDQFFILESYRQRIEKAEWKARSGN